MPTYVAFLRAINVTGRFVKMQVLADAFRDLGHADVRTFINSGNVIFGASQRSAARLAQTIEQGLVPALGFRAEAFVRTAAEVRAVAARAASLRGGLPAGGEVNVCFLPVAATPAHAGLLAPLRGDIDDFEVHDGEVYWLCRANQSASRFSNAVLERRLGLRSTLRRASMLERLAAEL